MASLLDLVKHYQRTMEKYPHDDKKVLSCINYLFNLAVTVQHLQDTGVGRTVNALRKEPGEVGQAARSLVHKWKLMVAAEESDQEGDHNNDTSTHNGHEKTSDDDVNQKQTKHTKQDHSSSSTKYVTSDQEHTNGNITTSKRKYQSSEEEEPDLKRKKHSSSSDDEHYETKRNIKIKQEPMESESDYSDNSQTANSYTESSSSCDGGRKVNIKVEHSDDKQKRSSSKHSSGSSHDNNKIDSLNSKRSHSKHHNSDSKLSSDKDRSSKHSKDKYDYSVKEKERRGESKSVEKHSNSDKHKSSDKHHQNSHKHSSSSEKDNQGKRQSSETSYSKDNNSLDKHYHKSKHSSSDKHHKHVEKDKSTHKNGSSSDSKSVSEKHSSKSDKKVSSHSQKPEKEKNKSPVEVETSKEKHSKSEYKKEKHGSTSKEKDRSGSSKHKSDKNSQSSDLKIESKSRSKTDDKNCDKKSKIKAGSSSSPNNTKSSSKLKDIPKKKNHINSEDSDDGIDCESGASFAEALGMISPTKPKKKATGVKDTVSPNNALSNDMSPAALLAPSAKLAPLPSIEISALPDISPNYKPRPPPKPLPHFTEEEAMNHVISSKNQRTKVYSGNKILGKIPSLYEMCVNVLQEHIDALEYTGGVPYEILKPVVDKATPQQLFMLEHYNPYLIEDTNHLWKIFCEKHFRNQRRQEMETWREMFARCQEEQECKLKSLTENIKIAQEAKKAPIKQTKMAYVDSIVKPPRNIARKQAIHGTARAAAASPAARVASLASAPNIMKGGSVRPQPAAPVSISNFNKPKKAPLMQKALQFMRGRKR